MNIFGWLVDVKGNVRFTLDKFKGIKVDLVCGNEGWKDWGFKDFLSEFRKWIEINLVEDNVVEKGEINRGILLKRILFVYVFKI